MPRFEPVPVRLVQPDWAGRLISRGRDALTPAQRHRHLDRLVAAGAFGEIEPAAFYVCRIASGGHTQVGMVGLSATDDYDHGLIRPHERHLDHRARAIAARLARTGAQSNPIMLAHPPLAPVTEVATAVMAADRPALDLTDDDGLHQQVWPLRDPAMTERLRSVFESVPLYLIDGHHRAAAMSAHRRRSGSPGAAWTLAVVFPTDQLASLALHRHLDGTAIDPGQLVADLRRHHDVWSTTSVTAVAARRPDELALLTGQQWHVVRIPFADHAATSQATHAASGHASRLGDNALQPVAEDRLDPLRLAHHVLGPLLGLDPSAPGDRLSYLPGKGDMADLAQLTTAGHQALWIMRPVPTDDVLWLADEGQTLPPKSTYFVPKARSGVFLRHLGPIGRLV